MVAQSNQAFTMGAGLFSNAGFTRFSNPADWDISMAESHTVGQATAVGLSMQGVSAAQFNLLKTRLDVTRAQLQARNLNDLTGEQISGDLLTATVWSWFAAAESHGRLSQNQANVTENPGLSYGFLHANAQPIYYWGVIQQVKFPDVSIDIPHQRSLSASRGAVAGEWVSYNRLRGQYMSALENAMLERFFNDTSKCNIIGSPNPIAGLPACSEGISAAKIIGIASQAGQKIYTITTQIYNADPAIVQTHLAAHSTNTRARVQSYLDAGFEVSIHEAPISQSGWVGSGFTAIDASTGAGGYLIEGGGNGGDLVGLGVGLVTGVAVIMAGPIVVGLVGAIGFLIGVIYALTLSIPDLLSFSANRLIGTIAGVALSVIVGQYVLISLSPLFVLSILMLMVVILRLLVLELVVSTADAVRITKRDGFA